MQFLPTAINLAKLHKMRAVNYGVNSARFTCRLNTQHRILNILSCVGFELKPVHSRYVLAYKQSVMLRYDKLVYEIVEFSDEMAALLALALRGYASEVKLDFRDFMVINVPRDCRDRFIQDLYEIYDFNEEKLNQTPSAVPMRPKCPNKTILNGILIQYADHLSFDVSALRI